jgi:hypothetical protein
MNELRLSAMADQINAAHRDTMESYRRMRAALLEMDSPDRLACISEIPVLHREILAGLAEEDGDKWLSSLLMDHGNA